MYQYIFSHISAVVCTCTNGHMCIIWMLHSWVHASRLRIFMLTRQKQQLHVHRLFQLMGTCRKKISDTFTDHHWHVHVLLQDIQN